MVHLGHYRHSTHKAQDTLRDMALLLERDNWSRGFVFEGLDRSTKWGGGRVYD